MTKDTLIALLTAQLADADAAVKTLERERQALGLSEQAQQEQGKLMVRRSHGYQQFYLREHKGKDGLKTVPSKNQDYIKALATKQYFDNLIESAQENQKISAGLLKAAGDFHDLNQESLLYLSRFSMVDEKSLLTDGGYLDYWKQSQTRSNPYRPEEKCYPTRDGAMVRSKSEQSIYNELLEYGVPFQYELELRLFGKTYYPDFTILDVKHKTEVYYEHFGLLNDEKYRLHYYQKSEAYMMLGLTYGTDYFCTFEDAGYPFDIRKVRRFLENRFPKS